MQRYTYHVGLATGHQEEIIDFGKIEDYRRLARKYGDGIKAIDMFTSTFDNQAHLLNALEAMGLIKGAGSLKLFLRDNSSKGLKVREVRMGLLYKDAWPFLSRDKIMEFVKANLSDPEFIQAAIDFFGVYFGAKNMPEITADTDEKELEQSSKKIPKLNACLVTLEQYLRILTFPYVTTKQSVINKSKAEKKAESERALVTMIDHLAYQKARNGEPLVEKSYRGFRDIALFCYHTGEVLKENKKSEKEKKKVEKASRSQKFLDDMAALQEDLNSSSAERWLSELEAYNIEHDTCLSEEDLRGPGRH